jgi:hypothetical protein
MQHQAGWLVFTALLYCIYQFTATRQTIYLVLSISILLLLAIVFGSLLILISFRTSVRIVKFILGLQSRLARPIIHKVSSNKYASFILEWFLRFSFWWSFLVLLVADRVVRRLLASWVGRHVGTGALYTVVNTSDPEFTFSNAFEPNMVHTFDDYDHDVAVTCAVASKLCYEDPHVVEYELVKHGFTDYRPILYRNTVGFIACKGEHVVLVFRGTSPLNLGNLWTDVQHGVIAFPESVVKGQVHAGFYKALGRDDVTEVEQQEMKRTLSLELSGENVVQVLRDTVWVVRTVGKWLVEHVLRHVRYPHDVYQGNVATDKSNNAWKQAHQHLFNLMIHPADKKRRHLWVSGHSLGAGLATLFVSKLLQHDSPLLQHVAGVYTYGMSRIGDAEFTASFPHHLTRRMFHHVLDNDIIARIPHTEPYHAPPGHLVHIKSSRKIIVHPDHSVPPIVFTKLHGLLNPNVIRRLPTETSLRVMLRFTFPFFFNDHFPGDYARALSEGRLQ